MIQRALLPSGGLAALKRRLGWGLYLAGLGIALPASGEELLAENAYLGEVPVVLTVSRLAQPQDEAPAAVTVIDRQMIKDSGAWELADVFRLVPGMYVAYHASSAYTTNSAVSYHGLSDAYSRRMQVLVDGRSVYSPLFGGVLWSDIPLALDDIERIEVIRGPNSAMYGANSFLGIINIITRHSAEEQGAFLSVSKGAGRSEGVARYGGRIGDLTYRVTASLRNDDGLDWRVVNPIQNNITWGYNKNDDKKIRLLTFRADYRASPVDEVEFHFGYNGGDRQEGLASDAFYPRWKSVDNHFELLRWRSQLGAGNELSLQFYHSYEGSKDTLLTNPVESGYTGLTYNADMIAQRYDLEAQHTFSPSASTRLVWGGSVRLDRVYSPLYLNRQEAVASHLSRLFANLEWRVKPQLTLNLGGMAENNDFTGTDVMPRAALNWHFLPGQTLRVGRSTATRTPSLLEGKADYRFRVPTGFPPPFPAQADLVYRYAAATLKPERIVSSEIGYLGEFSSVKADLRLFRDEVSDLIGFYRNDVCNTVGGLTPTGVLCLSGSNFSMRNSGNAVIKGFEAQFDWRLGPDTRLLYGLSHTRVASNDEDGTSYTASAPTNSQSLMLTHRFGSGWSGSLMGYQVGEMKSIGGSMVNSYRRWDGRVAKQFKVGGSAVEAALIVQNLSNERSWEYDFDNQLPGRTAWANLRLEY